MRRCKFSYVDYGKTRNLKEYGTQSAPNLGEMYHKLDMRVDLLAGEQDTVIPSSMVRQHYLNMQEQGVDVVYKEFACGHMGFTYHPRQDLTSYILSSLARGFQSNAREDVHEPIANRQDGTSGDPPTY
eukprot:scaffold1136_cov399-Prasinococcus_capsulatus_cf.AAC.2